MHTTRSDSSENTAESHKTAVREYLRNHGEVASKQDLRAGTDVPAWYINQIASTDTFYTSLNHNGEYVASKHVIGHRSTHDGFWRPQVDDGVAVFHRKEDTKPTLKHLAFTRPSGLTVPEANDLLGRRCYRPLKKLAEQGEVHAADWQDTTVYTHSWASQSGLRKVWILTEPIECMMGTRRFDVTEHLSEEALDRAINEAQMADKARLVRRLCFVKNLYAGDVLEEAARRVGVSQANSSRWAHAWNDAGVDGLRPSFGGGRPPKLSDKQFAELCDLLEEGQPWTPREIHTLIKDRYGVTYDPAHLSRKLRESGMHYAKPRPMDPRSPDDADEILAERLDST